MSLKKADLKQDLKSLFTELLTREDNSIDELAERLSETIDTYVKTATIKYTNGLTADGKPVVGTFNGNLE